MFICYVSLDDVNQRLAADTVEEFGATVDFCASQAELPVVPCDAVMYDLDNLPNDDRRHILDELSSGPAKRVSAMHSYNLPAGDADTLRRNGVVVRRRLQRNWLTHLIRRKMVKSRQLRSSAQETD
jgi:hypothetical protein